MSKCYKVFDGIHPCQRTKAHVICAARIGATHAIVEWGGVGEYHLDLECDYGEEYDIGDLRMKSMVNFVLRMNLPDPTPVEDVF